MESLNRTDATRHDGLDRQISAYLAASSVPDHRRGAMTTRVLNELPEGLDGPHLWQTIQQSVDRALAADEDLSAVTDRRLLARARLGHVLGPEGASLAMPEPKPALASPLSEDDRFSVPRPVRREMKQQALSFWKLASARAWKRKWRLGSSLRRGA